MYVFIYRLLLIINSVQSCSLAYNDHIDGMYPVSVFILYPLGERTKKKKVPDFSRTSRVG